MIVNIVSAYAPKVGLSAEENDDFWDSFIIVLSGMVVSMLAWVLVQEQ